MTILKTSNLTKTYKTTTKAVDNVSISIEKGDIFGLIGQNGAGKTTFMRMLTSLVHPTSGDIKLSIEKSRIGAIIEMPALYKNLTAIQNLEYYRIQRGISDKNIPLEVLKTVGLPDTGKKKFKDFSLGMKQRLGIAVSLLSSPDFLILDEPTNGLDPTGIIEIRDLIKSLSKEGITILISSHLLSELAQIATKYAIIHKGKLIKHLTSEQLQEECKQAISLVVDDVTKAAFILETRLNINDYKQISDNEIRIYGYLGDTSNITFELSKEGIRVSSIQEIGESLEDYYTKIIRGQE